MSTSANRTVGAVSRQRLDQKRRTREAILAGARALLERGETVSVAAAAKEVGVSKATAYRYFTEPARLAAEAGLAGEVARYEDITAGAEGLAERLLAITLYLFDYACDNEIAFRQYLARSLDASLIEPRVPGRGGRRMIMYRRALEEDGGLPEAAWTPLVLALTMTTGAEPMIALLDIARVGRAEARATVESVARVLIDHHLAETRPA